MYVKPEKPVAGVPNPAFSLYGPVWPYPLTLTTTTSGFASRRRSMPSPHRSSVPGRKFSISTSCSARSRRNISWPRSLRRSRVTDRLLRESAAHTSDSSPSKGSSPRRGSPVPGISTLVSEIPRRPRRRLADERDEPPALPRRQPHRGRAQQERALDLTPCAEHRRGDGC